MKTELIKHIENQFQATYYDISTLSFAENKAALEYIKKTMKELSLPVFFFIKPDLNASMRAMAIDGICYFILMRGVPDSSRTLTEIAHEFGHYYYAEKGYPKVRPISKDQKHITTATILSNAIMDPVINRELYNLGIDIAQYMQDVVMIQAAELMFGYPEYEKMDQYQKKYIKCLLIEKLQEWDIIQNAIPNAFVEIAEKKYKRLLVDSRNFVKKIKATGTNNPEKCIKLLRLLSKENDMEDEIIITSDEKDIAKVV